MRKKAKKIKKSPETLVRQQRGEGELLTQRFGDREGIQDAQEGLWEDKSLLKRRVVPVEHLVSESKGKGRWRIECKGFSAVTK